MGKIADARENLGKCICAGCPSYNESMKDGMQKLFCAKGKTDNEASRNGCICGACPLAFDFKLDNMYYCITGPEK
ncbi:MAG: DUF2769 domain-containing protein [Candidatus Krumholzibacteria bacterium]|nr:DUF2769 domain-containing protein [Candidatus Krumholzibacteria bacterium]